MSIIVDCVWSQWDKWSDCSQNCGGGSRTSKRRIEIESADGGEKCEGDNKREESCNLHPCPGMFFNIFLKI